MANVDYVREDLSVNFDQYDLIDNCIEGEIAVKKLGETYLPRADATNKSAESLARYDAYLKRGVFYNVTARTLSGFVGEIFSRDPVIEVPTLCEIVIKDADGSGVDSEQMAKKVVTAVIAKGRCGIFVDYPNVDRPASRAEMLSGDIRPTINFYGPKEIINWRTITRGGRVLLSLVVLVESYVYEDDGFKAEYKNQYRVLRLIDNIYTQQIWRADNTGTLSVFEEYQPRDGKGKTVSEIPFTFVGSKDNSPSIDPAPLYDLASLNIAHYRNSAEYEDSAYMLGQPTPYATGLTEDWVTEVLGGKVYLGSRETLVLPVGATVGLLQVAPNSLAFEAMEHKERQMVALGAKLVEQASVQRTATEAGLEHSSETSALTTIAKNCEKAYKWALEWCAIFTGEVGFDDDARSTVVSFELNTEFDLLKLSPEEISKIIEAWQNGALAWEEMRHSLRRSGYASLDDDEAKQKISEEMTIQAQNSADNIDPDPNADPTETGNNINV